MTTRWLSEDPYQSIFTELLQTSLRGGAARHSELSSEVVQILDEGVEDGVVEKDELIICDCNEYHSTERDHCPRCGELSDSETSDIIQYFTHSYPDIVKSRLGESAEGFEVQYDRNSFEDIKISDLEPLRGEVQRLHISPFFNFEGPVYAIPNHRDLFVDWGHVCDLLDDSDEFFHNAENFLDHLDAALNLAEGKSGKVLFTGPDGVGTATDTSWYTKLHRTTKDRAHEQSQARFGRNYNEQFERLGNEFLSILTPHAVNIQAGGSNEPDGYIITRNHAYIVESKCYSNDYKIFKEQDKANRYVRNFVESVDGEYHTDFNLSGYIFIAHEFNENEFSKDLNSFQKSNETFASLDVACITDQMMATGAEVLSDLYRHRPSAAYRIRSHTDFYQDLFKNLFELTGYQEIDEDRFKLLLDSLRDLSKDRTSLEKQLEEGQSRDAPLTELVQQRVDAES